MNASGEDDRDIKIAGSEKIEPEDNAAQDAEELRREHENGNLALARRLGKQLAQKLVDMDGEAFFGKDPGEDEALRDQRRLLFAFTAGYGVERFVPGKLLQDVTTNSFYNALKALLPEFYASLDSAGAFSFYYLCVRREEKPEAAIGKNFAMLSGKSGREVIERLGEALFIRFSDVIKNTITGFDFKNDTAKGD